jgi:hypothetical protein
MTRAPANLLAIRSLLLTNLNVDPNTVRDAELEPTEVGIVGDADHRGGYHCGSDRVVTNDYSVVESSRDRNGLTLDAAALDVGGFTVRSGGRTHTLPSFSLWCVGQCAANAPDTRDIREIIYSPDGTTVKRWDRLGKRTSGDSSHRWHTHFSFHRDAIKAGRDLTPLFRRYLRTIGLIPEEDELTPEERTWLEKSAKMADQFLNVDLGVAVAGTKTPLHQVLRHIAWPLLNGPKGSGAFVAGWMTTMAEQAGISTAELEQITAAAREGAAAAADELVGAVMAKLPLDQALSREDVEQAVRDAFSGGLAPDTAAG